MTEVIIKLDDRFNIHKINQDINTIFQNNNEVIFIFDIIAVNILNWKLLLSILPILKKYRPQIKTQLVKSIIVAPHKWQHLLLKTFFTLYKPIKPFHLVFSYDKIPRSEKLNFKESETEEALV